VNLTKADRGSGKALQPPITTFVDMSSCGMILIFQVNTSLIMMPSNAYACYCKTNARAEPYPNPDKEFPKKKSPVHVYGRQMHAIKFERLLGYFPCPYKQNPNTATIQDWYRLPCLASFQSVISQVEVLQ
jgi:hypothetical protein